MSTGLKQNVESHLSTITFNAIFRLQMELEKNNLNQATIADALDVSPGRVSQILNPDKSMTLKQMVRLARVMGLKACVVFYDDGDNGDKFGPLHPNIFESCWIACDRPVRMGQVRDSSAATKDVIPHNIVSLVDYAGNDVDRKVSTHGRTVSTSVQLYGTS
jgi:transcriptional regulator with XRE-family HTH domain